jgi:hypothetical protein
MPASLKDGVLHSIFLYAISASGNGDNPLLGNSPQLVTCWPPPRPDPPSNTKVTCSADNKTATLSWSPGANASTYALRFNYVPNDSASCTDGWSCPNSPDLSDDDYPSTSRSMSVVPGTLYTWWVHSVNSTGWSDAVAGPTFKCEAPTGPKPTATVSADDSSICPAGSPAGETSTNLHWSATNASSCSGTNFSTGGSTSGTKSVSPSATTNYSVVCQGSGGTSNQVSQTVTVKSPSDPSCSSAAKVMPSIVATPLHIHSGQSSKLTWSAGSCTSVTVTGENGFSSTQLSGTDVDTGAIYSTSKFTISGDCGSNEATVTVVPNIIEI